MIPDIVIALVGATATVVAAWLLSPARLARPPSRSRSFSMPILALGLAFTALLVSLFNFSEMQRPELTVQSLKIVSHTQGVRADEDLDHYLAPNVPASAQMHLLDPNCEQGSVPIAAWHEVTGSHPALDTMYTINATVENQDVSIALRARQGRSGYAYVDVYVLCNRLAQE